MRDIPRILVAGGTDEIAAAGNFIFLKSAPWPIKVVIDGQVVTMRAGDRRRPAQPFTKIDIQNTNANKPAYVVFVIGTGDYSTQLVQGQLKVAPGIERADGQFYPDTRVELSLMVSCDPTKSGATYAKGQTLYAYANGSSGTALSCWAGDRWIVNKGIPIVVMDPLTHQVLETLTLPAPPAGSGFWNLQYVWERQPGDPQYFGMDGAGNGLLTGYDENFNVMKLPSGANWTIQLPAPWANNGNTYGFGVDTKRRRLVIPNNGSGGGTLFMDYEGNITGQLSLNESVNLYNMGDGGMTYDRERDSFWLMRAVDYSPYELSADMTHILQQVASDNQNRGGSLAVAGNLLLQSNPQTTSINAIEAITINSYGVSARSGAKCAAGFVKPSASGPSVGVLNVTSLGGPLTSVSGEVIRAALEWWYGAVLPDDYLDYVYAVAFSNGAKVNGKTLYTMASGSESFLSAGINDQFTVPLPQSITLMIDQTMPVYGW